MRRSMAAAVALSALGLSALALTACSPKHTLYLESGKPSAPADQGPKPTAGPAAPTAAPTKS